jgi:hypothetical protein
VRFCLVGIGLLESLDGELALETGAQGVKVALLVAWRSGIERRLVNDISCMGPLLH